MTPDKSPIADNAVVTITTDGATRGNPGPGGWAALLEYGAGRHERLLEGEEPATTTNNVMELLAVAASLEALKRPCHVILRADSQYVLNGLRKLQAGGPLPRKNRPVWERLAAAMHPHTIEGVWVRGHSGDARNERVDAAANAAASRAYAAAEQQQPQVERADEWTLLVCSPTAQRPARWLLATPQMQTGGDVSVTGRTPTTAMYEALLAGLRAVAGVPDAAQASLRVLSNLELLIKQQRGEWRVRHPDQQRLNAQVAALRQSVAEIRFDFAPTHELLALLDDAQA